MINQKNQIHIGLVPRLGPRSSAVVLGPSLHKHQMCFDIFDFRNSWNLIFLQKQAELGRKLVLSHEK